MHDLTPVTALGGTEPRVDTIGTLTISEHPGVSLASVAMRNRKKTEFTKGMKALLGAVPGPGQYHFGDPISGFWMGPDQWMIGAAMETHEDLADQAKALLGDTASVTEQSGAWVVFDLQGDRMRDAMELLCAVNIRKMGPGDAQRTMIHQLGCFVIPRQEADRVYILGPRASAGSLHHALIGAAKSVA